jgi:hypothetical protein
MPNISISKIKVRRGSDDQRKQVILDQGELGYVVDTKRLFVGTGTLSGGAVVGSKTHPPLNNVSSLTSLNAQENDTCSANGILYQLINTDYSIISNWQQISPVVDDVSIEYDVDSKLTIKSEGVQIGNINSNVINKGLYKDSSGISVKLTDQFELSSNAITIKSEAVTENEISSDAFYASGGISGGGIDKIKLNVGSAFQIDNTNTLQLCSIPGSLYDVDPSQVGNGLSLVDGKLTADVRSGDGYTTQLSGGKLSLVNRGLSATAELGYLEYDEYGLPITIQTSIYNTLTGTGATVDDDGTPIGTILPHAAAIGQIPSGYLLCDGSTYAITAYQELYNVIGGTYGEVPSVSFDVPDISNGVLYGSNSTPDYSSAEFLTLQSSGGLSAVPVNYIIKASVTSINNCIFKGSPGQITNSNIPSDAFIYNAVDSDGTTLSLSSAGFITFEGDITTRGDESQVDRFAIPVFNF